jgi:hypothetical protein
VGWVVVEEHVWGSEWEGRERVYRNGVGDHDDDEDDRSLQYGLERLRRASMKESVVMLRWPSGGHCRGGGPWGRRVLDLCCYTSSAARPGGLGACPHERKRGP